MLHLSSRVESLRGLKSVVSSLACALVLATGACGSHPQRGATRAANPQVTNHHLQGDPRVVVPHAQKTIALTMPQFRRCFERLQVSGKISLVLTIDQAGGVAEAQARGPVPREVRQCVESRARKTQFASPEGGRMARLDVPLAVIRQ